MSELARIGRAYEFLKPEMHFETAEALLKSPDWLIALPVLVFYGQVVEHRTRACRNAKFHFAQAQALMRQIRHQAQIANVILNEGHSVLVHTRNDISDFCAGNLVFAREILFLPDKYC